MKKLLAVLLVLCLLPWVYAEDVSALTDDELRALYTAVDAEMKRRELSPSEVFPGGLHIGGVSIAAGTVVSGMALNFGQIRMYDSYERMVNDRDDYVQLRNILEGEYFTFFFGEGMCWFSTTDLLVISITKFE